MTRRDCRAVLRRDMAFPGRGRHAGGLAALLAVAYAALVIAILPFAAEAAERPLRLVALGDSLTAGFGLPADAAFPVVMEKALRAKGRDVTVANAGVSGDTTTGGLERLDWSVPEGTDGVILELGANDMLRGTDPAVPERNLDAILARLKARGIPVLIAGMLASKNLGTDYAKRFDSIFPGLAKRYESPLYPFFLDGVAGDRALNQGDGLHPTAKGVEVIVGRMLPAVDAFVVALAKRS